MYVEESKMEADERLKRLRRLLKRAEEKLEMERLNKERRGYCPKCNMLLPESGKCHCGYVRQTPYTRTNVKNGYVNPAILAMYK